MRSCDDFCDLLDFQSSALWLFTVKNGFGQKSHFLRGIYHDENIDKKCSGLVWHWFEF
jgi:hypothetical protein